MDTALVRFVGAGITSVAAGLGFFVPRGAIAGGYNVVDFLTRQGNKRTSPLVTEIVRDLLLAWRQTELPLDVARGHLEMLPKVIDDHRPDVDLLVNALASNKSSPAAPASVRPNRVAADNPARRVANEVMDRARAANVFDDPALNETVARYFLERLYGRLLSERSYFDDISLALDVYFYKSLWKIEEGPRDLAIERKEPAAALPVPEPKRAAPAQLARAPGGIAEELKAPERRPAVPVAAPAPAPVFAIAPIEPIGPLDQSELTAIARRHAQLTPAFLEIARRRTSNRQPLITLEDAEGCLEELAELVKVLDPAMGEISDVARLRGQAAWSLKEGRIDDADAALGEAEDVDVRLAQADIEASRTHLKSAAETRSCRGAISKLCGDCRKAANHFAAAVRFVPQFDRKSRWQQLMRQGLMLIRHGELCDDTAALTEAADVYREATNLLNASEAPQEWTAAVLDLAKLLVLLGARERRADRVDEAIASLRPAIDGLARQRAVTEWGEAEIELGHALALRHELEPDEACLKQAIESFRSALGVLTPELSPSAWRSAQSQLGLALLDLSDASGEPTHLVAAQTHLAAALDGTNPQTASFDWARTMAALAQVQYALGEARQDHRLLALSANSFESAIAASDAARYPLIVAELSNALGLTRWHLGERTHDTSMLAAAAQAKVAALDAFEASGETERAELVRAELERLQSEMTALINGAGGAEIALQRSA